MDTPTIHRGLEGVVADTTALSLVDGEAGRLYYRGYAIETLVDFQFVDVAHLLLFGELPDCQQRVRLEEFLSQAGRLPRQLVATVESVLSHRPDAMVALQSLAPLLALKPPAIQIGRTPEEQDGLVVAARFPLVIAMAHARLRGATVRYDPLTTETSSYGARFLTLLHGRVPTKAQVRTFESLQILQLDHGFNAGTFAARIATSTLAPPAAAISAAAGTLFGPLHGAADRGALEMALEVGSPDKAHAFVAQCLATKRLVLGMGHREYRVVDPRAKLIREMAEAAAVEPGLRQVLDTLNAVDRAFTELTKEKLRPLRANLEYYKGIVFLALGIPKELFTSLFAASRVFGWVAHMVEQRANNRIIRPSAHYIGPAPRLPG